eukprot:m.115536 g.115536  ORF g.115536 m.115536 type:complete len:730 (-) comp28432_c0_seq1:40-2229(-)
MMLQSASCVLLFTTFCITLGTCRPDDRASFRTVGSEVPESFKKARQISQSALDNIELTEVTVDPAWVSTTLNPLFMGCHLDSGYGQELGGLDSNLAFSPSFEFGDPSKNYTREEKPMGTGWVPESTTGVVGTMTLNPEARHGQTALQLAFKSGTGLYGVANRGIGWEGLYLEGGKGYEGYVFAKSLPGATQPAELVVAIQNYLTGDVLTKQVVGHIQPGSNWTMYNFSLTPSATTDCATIEPGSDPLVTCTWKPGTDHDTTANVCIKCAGQLFVGLATPGEVLVDYTVLQPQAWGRFKGLPVLKNMVEALQEMGVTLFRAGGTVAELMHWKDWRGPVYDRKPLIFNNNQVTGFGPFETIDLCSAAGILPVITTAAAKWGADDLADIVEYAWGNSSTLWGKQRISDGHPKPYNVTWFELGNEQQNPNFLDQVVAMEARAAAVGLPKNSLQYLYPWGGGSAGAGGPMNKTLAEEITKLGLGARIAVDDHVFATGGVDAAMDVFADPILGPGKWGAINLETNCGDHTFFRAMTEAQDLMRFFGFLDSRLLGRAASFCMERAGYNSGGWNDQGLIFYLPNMTYFQPPAYVHSMISKTSQADVIKVTVKRAMNRTCASAGSYPAQQCVDVTAQISEDGYTLSVQVLNMGQSLEKMEFQFVCEPQMNNTVTVTWLHSNDTHAVNSPANPTNISPFTTTENLLHPILVPANTFAVFVVKFPASVRASKQTTAFQQQ